jgi:hypothetical protein
MVPLRAKIERSFIMDYTVLKKIGLDRLKIDLENSYESFDLSTNNDTIFIHLNEYSKRMIL